MLQNTFTSQFKPKIPLNTSSNRQVWSWLEGDLMIFLLSCPLVGWSLVCCLINIAIPLIALHSKFHFNHYPWWENNLYTPSLNILIQTYYMSACIFNTSKYTVNSTVNTLLISQFATYTRHMFLTTLARFLFILHTPLLSI